MPRAIASLSLSFGLVSIPVKLYSATESSNAIRFKLMRNDGARVKQQYISEEPEPRRSETASIARAAVAAPREEPQPQPSAPASNVRPFTRVLARAA